MPGAYAEVHLAVPTDATAVRLPVNALLFRSEGLRAAVVKDGKIQLRELTVGRDFGSAVEILSGVTTDDQVVINPPDSLAEGQTVHIVTPAAAEAK
jgi:hypothetical protein